MLERIIREICEDSEMTKDQSMLFIKMLLWVGLMTTWIVIVGIFVKVISLVFKFFGWL